MSIASLPAWIVPIVSPDPSPPVADMIQPHLEKWLSQASGQPLIVGICGAQGSGKSTVSGQLHGRLTRAGLSAAVLSLDDLYLGPDERVRLASSVHPLLRTRGVPGTHNISLGLESIAACRVAAPVCLPRFSKALDAPEPVDRWEPVRGPVDVLLFEGWCVGARAQRDAALAEPVNSLEAHEDPDGSWRRYVNHRLADDYQTLFAQIDHLILLRAPDFSCVAEWRTQQERQLRTALAAAGTPTGKTMSDEEVRHFIQHYERITRNILEEMPIRADLTIYLDALRRPKATFAGAVK